MRTQLLQRNTVGQYLEFFYHENILAFALQLYLRIANIIKTMNYRKQLNYKNNFILSF